MSAEVRSRLVGQVADALVAKFVAKNGGSDTIIRASCQEDAEVAVRTVLGELLADVRNHHLDAPTHAEHPDPASYCDGYNDALGALVRSLGQP